MGLAYQTYINILIHHDASKLDFRTGMNFKYNLAYLDYILKHKNKFNFCE
jgi:hypothetical protein